MKNPNALKKAARWVAGIVGLTVAVFVVIIVWNKVSTAYANYQDRRQKNDPTYLHSYSNRYVSPYIVFHDSYDTGYLYDVRQGRRTMSGIQWICRSEDGDSLTFFCDGEKRGFFNRFTGKLAIPPQYDKAWVFAEGVACVVKHGQVQFIDHAGKALLSQPFAYTSRIDDYCFHNGLCMMMGDNERIGLVDKQGRWVVNPAYKEIDYMKEGFWLVYDSVWNKGLLYADGREFLPCKYKELTIDDNVFVTGKDHLDQVYDFEGNLVNACNFQQIELMSFEGDEYVYNSYFEGYERKTGSANLRRYMSSDYYYGLIDKDGNIVTPPSYSSIEAIAADRYHCEGPKGAVILDDKGRECGKKL